MKQLKLHSWTPSSWQGKSMNHLPEYDFNQVKLIIEDLKTRQGIVSISQIKSLRENLSLVNQRKAFLIQAGDCAEPLGENDSVVVSAKINLIQHLSTFIPDKYKPVLVGRIAGQYAKPRSFHYETRDLLMLTAYHGDIMNRIEFTPEARKLDPALMLSAYDSAKIIMTYIDSAENIFTSHESLQLFYEEGLTRFSDEKNEWYALSTHFPWLGMRTAINSDAHVEYLRGLQNPIAIKLGPFMTTDRLLTLIDLLNPNNELGKMTLIHRVGESAIEKVLPQWISAIQSEGKNVIWSCDPMHGNTEVTADGIKTRKLHKIMSEVQQAFTIHKQAGSFLGSIHLETSPYNVTECIDESSVLEQNLKDNYKSYVDPRLNPHQACQVMEVVSKNL